MMMKPRNLIQLGIVLGETLILGFVVLFSIGFFGEGDLPVHANQVSVFSQQGLLANSPSLGLPASDGDSMESQAVFGQKSAGQPVFGDAAAKTEEAVSCGPPSGWVVYAVEEGETLDYLAQVYGVQAADLGQANCLGEAGVLMAGMSIFVPPTAPQAVQANSLPQNTSDQGPTQQAAATQKPASSPTPEPTGQVVVIEETEIAGEVPFEELDLRSAPISPTEDYVSNPGMGWQYRGGTFPITYPAETVSYSQRNQISWIILNPDEGMYNWGPLDSQMNTAVGQGKQFSFRVYTMIGESFGGAQVPQWVLDKGAVLLPSGEPNYANCTYQQEWGKFVNALIKRYDGNPNIAYIDISGYGNFNEWSWQDQTVWDEVWATHYARGDAGPETMSTMDSYARRILADMFIGGSFSGHPCVDADNNVQTYDYSYKGFKSTQLVMPFAGVIQSTQYVFTKSQNVGFRYDCLGRSDYDIVGRLGSELAAIWPNAPVVYETCKPDQYTTSNAVNLIQNTHPILIHDVNLDLGTNQILPLLEPLGYEYSLNYLGYSTRGQVGQPLLVKMEWQNDGITPSYPRMGQKLELHVYLVDQDNERAADMVVPVDISSWMPASTFDGTPPVYAIDASPVVPEDVPHGVYRLEVEIVNARTGEAIWLPERNLNTMKIGGIIIAD